LADSASSNLVEIEGLEITFGTERKLEPSRSNVTKALRGVSLSVPRGKTVGIVGESGSGKTTLGRAVLQLYKPSAGRIVFDGVDLATLNRRGLKGMRREIQMVFQDPFGSLNPRMRVGEIVGEPLLVHGLGLRRDVEKIVREMLDVVGLAQSAYERFPREFSGGQRQRINIARALVTRPKLVIADEPTSALDVSVQAQIINLFQSVQSEFELTYMFISHDLGVVRIMADEVVVMQAGEIVESGDVARVFDAPQSDYTRELINAVPRMDPRMERERKRALADGAPDSAAR
jgi:oligopeptide transport system ATP-binding protein